MNENFQESISQWSIRRLEVICVPDTAEQLLCLGDGDIELERNYIPFRQLLISLQ